MKFKTHSILGNTRRTWLVTGAAGFIGSNLVEALLAGGQNVVGLDNFSTGRQRNLDEVERSVGAEAWRRLRFLNADIRDAVACTDAVRGVDHVLHQAALGSVPRSIEFPLASHESNVTGFLNILVAAQKAKVKSFVYASSSANYGDEPNLPKIEERIGSPLSPYAVTKLANELYAAAFARCYDFPCIGLRYFNVFGQRQDPKGAYAAVIPKWISAMIANEAVTINGDGETSRDFCFIANAIQANLRASLVDKGARGEVFNVAAGAKTTLNVLFSKLRDALSAHQIHYVREPVFTSFRAGDVRHSLADISKARRLLSYDPTHGLDDGIAEAIEWYVSDARGNFS